MNMNATSYQRNNSSGQTNMKYVLLSCLQKSVRRQEIDLALNCMKELDLNGSSYGVAEKTLWTKLKVYCAEDIGPASYGIASYIGSQDRKYRLEKNMWAKRVILMNAVNYLCRQNKSRLVDKYCSCIFQKKTTSN